MSLEIYYYRRRRRRRRRRRLVNLGLPKLKTKEFLLFQFLNSLYTV